MGITAIMGIMGNMGIMGITAIMGIMGNMCNMGIMGILLRGQVGRIDTTQHNHEGGIPRLATNRTRSKERSSVRCIRLLSIGDRLLYPLTTKHSCRA